MSIFYYVPAVIGVALICLGAWHGWKLRALMRRCTAAATGTLLGFVEKKTKGSTLYFPVVTFEVQGKTYRQQYAFGNAEWPFVAGDAVSLRYNPADPADIYLYHEQGAWRQYASPVCIIIGGLLFIAAYYGYGM
ncbi:DUF3592 domain-containing protein [uncultured Megasphaera sp.]|uniref:DUF3592 domain-containing protein n=1 Tax=uncultured Megasphaera sp. TaxID=165188 RepID=UPI002659E810|nr:DUF3592 domain-containing protein [uncultured Megasphaera sp.]